jgi:hypothetical protein
MKKSVFIFILMCEFAAIGFAQGDKVMVSAGARIMTTQCIDCGIFSGIELAGGYAVTEKIVASLNVGYFSKSESYITKVFDIGVSVDGYFKEAYKGFYAGGDVTIILEESYPGAYDSSIDFTLNLGWAIGIGEHIRIIPHLGYGTWLSNYDKRIIGGLKFGYKL